MLKRLMKTENFPLLLPRIIVGVIFLSEGIQKLILPELVGAGRFAKIGFTHPEFWASFTACFEITCGIFVVFGFFVRIASIPLLIIMATAFVSTKYPLLVEKGFWIFAHEYRTDFAMTVLLVLLLLYGSGNHSFDKNIYDKPKK
jgi:putative oxidoreductase